MTDTVQSIPRLTLTKESLMSPVLLTVKVTDGVAVALECGGSVAGRVEAFGTSSHIFYGTSQGYVVFSLCSDYTDFDTVLTILDDDDAQVGHSDDYCGKKSSLLHSAEDDAFLTLVVHGYFDTENEVLP